MLTTKQIRMLVLLDNKIRVCKKCDLHNNGRCKPFYTKESRYAIIGEAPGSNEVRDNEPFTGAAGDILWETMADHGLEKDKFLIINSVNCRPVDENQSWKNGKPTEDQQDCCREWVRKYIRVFEPEKILVLGNYAMYSALGHGQGIMKLNATIIDENQVNFALAGTLGYDNAPYVLSVHPAFCIYRKDEGLQMLSESIARFKEIEPPSPPMPDFVTDFLEDEELWKI